MALKKFDVISFGSATKDIFIQTDESEVIPVKHTHTKDEMLAFPLGAKILIKKTHYMVGGGGANAAVSLARQGFKVAYLGKLGADSYKEDILEELHKENIEFIGVVDKKHETNYSIILNSRHDDRTILAHKDASSQFTWREVNKKKLHCSWVYASSMMGKSFDMMSTLFSHVRKYGTHIAFNPSSYQAKMGKKLYPILKLVDVLIFNLEEACLLMGEKEVSSDKKFLKKLLVSISGLGPKIVVITNALDGAYTYSAQSGHFIHAYGRRVKVRETTGAGDAFASSFIAGLMHQSDIHYALHYAMINAESVVENYGAHNILLSRKQIEARMKKFKRKVVMF